MNKNNQTTLYLIIGIIVLVFVFSSFFIVSETEQCVITRLGAPIGDPITKAGLHFKLPFVDKAIRIEKRVLEWDGYPNQIPTRDKKYILVDTTARWKIVDALKFIQTVINESGAQSRLDDIIDSATREAISRHDLVETVRNSNQIIEREDLEEESIGMAEERMQIKPVRVGRTKIQTMILDHALPTIKEYGIELIDVRIKRLNYEKSVQQKVFERMISERKRIAEKLRSEGLGKKAEIDGRMSLELNKIQSEAYRKAQEIKGRADAQTTAIYANAYSKDTNFFNFYRTLEAYQNTLDDRVTLFLSSDSEFLEILNN